MKKLIIISALVIIVGVLYNNAYTVGTTSFDPTAVHQGDTLTGDVTATFDVDGSTATTIASSWVGTEYITTLGTITTGTWQATDIDVPYGGTGASTFTDGGILLGSGTSTLTAMAVLADGSIVVGDGSTDPVALAAFSSSTGDLKHEAGGLEADVSGYTDGIYGMASGATLDIDTIAEIETAIGGTNILIETEIDASSELLALMDDETGTGVLVFGTNPTLTGATLAGILADNDDMVFEADADSDGSNKYSFTDGDSTEIAALTEAGALQLDSNLTIGANADVDYTLTFDGDTSNGVLNYDEDNADFEFDQDVHTSGAFVENSNAVISEAVATGGLIFGDSTPDADGEIAFDTDGDGATITTGVINSHDGTAAIYIFGVDAYPGADNYIMKYDAGTNKIKWEPDSSGGTTAWDDVADPDNSGLTTITFDNAETSLLTGDNDAAASFLTIQNSDADHTGGNLYLLDLDYSADDGDVDADFIKFQDSGSVVMTIQQNGEIATDGGITAGGAIEGATLTEGGVAVYNDDEMDTKAELEGILTDVADIAEADGDTWTGVHDFGGATSFEIVNAAAPTTDATGEIALDTTIADHQPLLQYYDGGETMTVIAIDTAQLPALDDEIIKYDAAADKFVLEADAGAGGATAWDDITDPDAAATIDFVTYTQTIDIGVTDDGGPKSGLILDVTGLGAGTTDVIALEITTATNDDTDYIPIAVYDDSGADNDELFKVDSIGAITTAKGVYFSDGALIYQLANNYVQITENSDYMNFNFAGTDVGIIWSDGALNLRNAEDGVDAIVEIEGKDAGEKGILRVLSDGDDKYTEIYHDDTDAHVVSSSGDIHIEAAGGDINFADDNIVTTGTLGAGAITGTSLTDGTASIASGAVTAVASLTFTGADASPDATGEIQYDSTVAGMSGGGLRWYDDDSVRLLVDLETDPSNDDYVVAYDAAVDGFYMKVDADTGGGTLYSAIGDPDAAGSISFDDTETATYSTAQNTAGSFMTIDNTVADVTNNVYLLDLDYSVDDNQANADYLKCQDAGGVVFTIQQNGDVASTGTIEGATLTEGGNAVYNATEHAWSIGDGSSGDITFTFNGDAGDDGTLIWDVTEDDFTFNEKVEINTAPANAADPVLHLQDLTDTTSNLVMDIQGNNRADPFGQDNDEAYAVYKLDDDLGAAVEVARVTWKIIDASNASVDTEYEIGVVSAGSVYDRLSIRGGGIVINEDSLDSNIRIESNNNQYLLMCDGGLDTVTVGSVTSLGLLGVDGQSDEVQLSVQGNATQTAEIFVVENSAGTDIFAVDEEAVTVVTDGTGTAEVVLPAGSIDGTEILDDTVANADINWADIDNLGDEGLHTLDTAYNGGNTIDVDGSAVSLTVSDTDNNRVLEITQNEATNAHQAVLITSTSADNALMIDMNGDAGNSESSGGALLIDSTGNVGIGLNVFSNAGSTVDGDLVNIFATNAAFDETVLRIKNDGVGNCILASQTITSGGATTAFSFNSDDVDNSTFGIGGDQDDKGTVKITHTKPAGADGSAAAISIDLAGDSTTAMGLFIDSTGTPSTTGDLIELRDNASTVAEVQYTGLITSAVGFDAVGAVDLDYGSVDVTDHTFVTDNTGDDEIFLPNDSIGPAEIDSTTGAYDFGGVTSLEIPNAESTDGTLSALGQIHIRGDEDRISAHLGAGGEIAGEVTKSFLYYVSARFDPGAWYDSDAELFLFTVEADMFPNGIIIDEWSVSCNVDPDVEMNLDLRYADAWIGLANAADIDELDTTNGVSSEDTDANINGGSAVAVGKVVYLGFDADPEGTGTQMIFEMWFHAEED